MTKKLVLIGLGETDVLQLREALHDTGHDDIEVISSFNDALDPDDPDTIFVATLGVISPPKGIFLGPSTIPVNPIIVDMADNIRRRHVAQHILTQKASDLISPPPPPLSPRRFMVTTLPESAQAGWLNKLIMSGKPVELSLHLVPLVNTLDLTPYELSNATRLVELVEGLITEKGEPPLDDETKSTLSGAMTNLLADYEAAHQIPSLFKILADLETILSEMEGQASLTLRTRIEQFLGDTQPTPPAA